MNINIMQWFDTCTLYFMGMSLTLNVLIAYLWHIKFYRKLGLKTYKAVQRIHLNETPRLGGLIYFISLVSIVACCNSNESTNMLKLILICLTPIFFIGLKEDLFHNVDPTIRLLALFLVGWLFRAQFTGQLPNLTDIPILSKFLLLQGGVSLFYILSISTIANGMNLIDGVNGLCGATTLSILGAFLFVSFKTNDILMQSLIFTLIIILIPFLLVNYPLGKIFLGDLGAYSLGVIVSLIAIILFGRHPEISPWGAVLILIYPITEVIFSLLRRVFQGNSIFHPDISHLHLKIFNFFRPYSAYKKMANALVLPCLSGLWLFPLLVITWVFQNPLFIWIGIFFFIFFYCLIYALVPNVKK
jgi:UDP-N-acetylmuramyl pentapeptide phosphotransferase/UDP-N-acetylglucosamine-1-phosphate transferase